MTQATSYVSPIDVQDTPAIGPDWLTWVGIGLAGAAATWWFSNMRTEPALTERTRQRLQSPRGDDRTGDGPDQGARA